MRKLVGRVRNAMNVAKPLGKLLPKAEELLQRIKTDLAQLGMGSEVVVAEQCRIIDRLVACQAAYLASMVAAHDGGDRAPVRPEGLAPEAPLPLPMPGARVDFGRWSDEEEQLAAGMEAAEAGRQASSAEKIIAIARLCCNASHQLQNLAVAPLGGVDTAAHGFLKQLDKLAGKCENASRAIMVLAHRWHMTQRVKPVEKLLRTASELLAATEVAEELVTAAASAHGGAVVPVESLRGTVGRVARLASILCGAELPRLHPAAERSLPANTLPVMQIRCDGCDFALTGLAQLHCCKACERQNGQHGGRCQRIQFGVVVSAAQRPRCAGCSFAVTGIRATHCCGKCAKVAGEHGPRCQRVHPTEG